MAPSRDASSSGARRDAANASAATRFDFRSGPWVNLHHVLYREGLAARGGELGPSAPRAVLDMSALDARERASWDAAVAFYASGVSPRDVVRDGDLVRWNAVLSAHESASSLASAGLPERLTEALTRAMPIYRARAWPAHDRDNRAWIARVTPALDRHGAAIVAELTRALREAWPPHPLRVDVTTWAPPPGAAYTTFAPAHLTISGSDPRNQPPAALEILFHECAHLIIRPTRDALSRELAAHGKNEPTLWHALLFFTSGEAVRRQLAPGYVRYADREGLYTRRWAAYRAAMTTHWVPYLDGRASFDDALRSLVAAL